MRLGLILIIAIGIIVSAYLAATVSLFEIPDGYFYMGLGNYLYTGNVPFVAPFNVTIPQTLFAPIYALIIFPLLSSGRVNPLFAIPFFQLLLLLFSTIVMSQILKTLFPRKWLPIGILLFLFLPFQLIYAFFMMSETLTTFFITLYVAVLVLFRKEPWQRGVLVLIASLMVLTRYALVPMLALSLLFWIASKPKKITTILPALIGLFFIACWVGLHIRLYHAPLLSTFTGRHIYNNVITAGKFLPKDRSNPKIAEFFSYIPEGQEPTVPWWNLQIFFGQAFRDGKLTELDVDRMFLLVSLAGIKEHPIKYLRHIITMTIKTVNTPPYHDDVLTQLGFAEPKCDHCGIRMCRFGWLPDICRPPKAAPRILTLFGQFMLFNKALYPFVTSIFLILAIIGAGTMFLTKKPLLVLLPILFITQHLFQSATEWIEGRFLLPLYPLYTILIVQGIITLSRIIKRLLATMEQQQPI